MFESCRAHLSVRADLYDLVYGSKDYAGEARRIHEIVRARSPDAASLLDVACGTGRHLEHLVQWYEVEGLDIDAAMLERARDRLGGIPLHAGDMRAFDLRRRFDVVTCLFSSIAQVRTADGLDAAVSAMARHVHRGGLLLIEPWISPEQHPAHGEPWVDVVGEPGKIIVVMETSTLAERVWLEDEHVLVWTAAGIEHRHERTETGAFTREDHLRAFDAAGLDVEHDPVGLIGRGLFIGMRAVDQAERSRTRSEPTRSSASPGTSTRT